MVMLLTEIDIINGIFTLGMVIGNISMGIILISKSREAKNRTTLLFMGISLMLLITPWVANSINFLLLLLKVPSLTPETHLAIALVALPFANLAWMVVMTNLLFNKQKKPILAAYAAYAVIFNVILFTLLPIDYTLVGTFDSPIDTVYSSLFSLLILGLLGTVLITSIWFFAESRKAESPQAKLKATFFLLSTSTFVTASILDARLSAGVIMIIIIRFMLLLGAIEIYWAFLMPDYIQKIFLKDKK